MFYSSKTSIFLRNTYDLGTPLMVLSPLSSTTRGVPRVRVFAKIQNSKHRFSKLRFHIFLNRVKITKIAMTFGQPTYQPWPKVWNVFESSSSTPHPRFNDGAKTQGGPIIEPGVRGFIIASGVRGIGENSKIVTWKKLHTFVEHGRKSRKKLQNVFEKIRDP